MEKVTFEVDVEKQVLRQTDNPANEISFISQMTDFGDHYMLTWDATLKNAGTDPEKVEPLIIPPLIALDPEGMSLKYGIPVNQLQGKSDFEVIVDQEALQLRKTGVLPQIDIAGEVFTVDLHLHELRHRQYFFPVISLRSFALTNDGAHFEAYYHPVMKQTVELDPKLLEFPESVIKIKIPNELGLDPVATASIYGMDEREVLRRYPIQKDLKAEVIPLSETNVPTLIRQNKEKLRQEHEQNARQVRPRVRPKF
jgi:hypothetical protein